MTTESHLTDEAIQQGATEFPPPTRLELCPDPYQKVVISLTGDAPWDKQAIRTAAESYLFAIDVFGMSRQEDTQDTPRQAPFGAPGPQQQQPQPSAQPQQQRAQPQQGGQQSYSRADKHPEIVGWECDICNGPVGLQTTQGGARMAKCLSKCSDPGNQPGRTFIHTVKDAEGTPVWVPDDAELVLPF